jgi:4'-phosphopantetheinyl transferase
VDLAQLRDHLGAFGLLLAVEERERADRYRIRSGREQFIIARGVLRLLLGQYLRTGARQVHLTFGPHGRPELRSQSGAGRLRFSISHASGVSLCAITLDRDVGVDLELPRYDLDLVAIADLCLAPREAARVRLAPTDRRARWFYRCWTRAEACLKARGVGLAAADRGMKGPPLHVTRLSLPERGYVAALAVGGGKPTLKGFLAGPWLLARSTPADLLAASG